MNSSLLPRNFPVDIFHFSGIKSIKNLGHDSSLWREYQVSERVCKSILIAYSAFEPPRTSWPLSYCNNNAILVIAYEQWLTDNESSYHQAMAVVESQATLLWTQNTYKLRSQNWETTRPTECSSVVYRESTNCFICKTDSFIAKQFSIVMARLNWRM